MVKASHRSTSAISASCALMASFCHSSHIAFNSKTSSQLRLSNVVFIFLFVRRWAFPHSLETLNHGLRKKSTPKTTFFYFFFMRRIAHAVPTHPVFSKKLTRQVGLRRGTAYFSISTRVSHKPNKARHKKNPSPYLPRQNV